MEKLGEALTWDDLAEIYDLTCSGRSARTLPMNQIISWAERQKETFRVSEKEGTIHRILKD